MTLKKLFTAAIVAGALTLGLALVSCGSAAASPEDAIAQDIAAQLDPIKTLDDASLDALVTEAENAGGTEYLADMGIDTREYFKAVLSGFDYTIDSMTVDGDSATVNLTVTSKTFAEVSNVAQQKAADLLADAADISSTDEMNAKIGEVVMQSIDEAQPEQHQIGLSYAKNGDAWEPTTDVMTTVMNEAFYAE